ncbi:Trm112 family protein [Pseudooceanicola sp. HF7]|uniref:Trm112 family protein n=1 Tax=Pseudooceanicola sp. HF7 TaxID=2721560 RepID=UPI00142F933F|nr:Trm112 family protein [Pseudooceanicola sp. HF7]NIZ10559.1 Trm112 family protein [Pseudooceanicola sp. HF7]
MTETPEETATPALFDRRMLEALVCPESHTTLRYDAEAQELISEATDLAFPIRNGIPILLVDEARRLNP